MKKWLLYHGVDKSTATYLAEVHVQGMPQGKVSGVRICGHVQ